MERRTWNSGAAPASLRSDTADRAAHQLLGDSMERSDSESINTNVGGDQTSFGTSQTSFANSGAGYAEGQTGSETGSENSGVSGRVKSVASSVKQKASTIPSMLADGLEAGAQALRQN